MRRRAKLDSNHRAVGAALVARGASVFSLAGEGKGCPDLLVGWHGRNYLIEVKRPGWEKPAGKTRDETRHAQLLWSIQWVGQYTIVTSPEEALAFLEMQR